MMMKFLPVGRLILLLLGFFLFTLIFPAKISAESFVTELESENLNMPKWVTGSREVLGEEGSRGVMDAIIEGLTIKIMGTYNSQGEQASSGAFGTLMGMTGFLYTTKPVSTQRYLAYLGNNFGVANPVYAQGEGWKAMEPILPIWRAMRNVCYLFFIVVFVAVGFMIMFRHKTDPQTTINIQNALPKIIIALILVTFSYAIVGLLIDLSGLLTGIIATVLGNEGLANPVGVKELLRRLTDPSVIGSQGTATPHAAAANIFTVMGQLLQSISPILDSIQNILSTIPYVGGVARTRLMGSTIVTLILAITILSAIVRTFFMLLSAYVTIVLSAIFSPFAFFMNAIPGGKGAGQWFKNLLASVIVFPVTFLLLIFAATLAKPPGDFDPPLRDVATGIGSQGFTWSPAPFGLYWQEMATKRGYFEIAPLFISNLLALGIILVIPNVAEVIKSFMEGKPSTGIGEGIRGGLAGAAKRVPIIGGLIS